MQDRQLVYEDFADKVGQIFAVADETAPSIVLTLESAEPLKTPSPPLAGRSGFSLIFLSEDERVLSQRLYRIEQEALGAIGLFLVPIGKDKNGVSYQALFN